MKRNRSSLSLVAFSAQAEQAQLLMEGVFDLGYDKKYLEELHWQESALCAQTDPDVFFPEKAPSKANASPSAYI